MVFTRLCTLNLLRFFVVSLSTLLLFKLHRLATEGDSIEPSLPYASIDPESAPSLDSETARLLRLHELLARPQIKCGKKLLGEAPEDFFLCTPQDFKRRINFTSGLLISGSAVYRGDFEAALSINKWTAIVPPGDQTVLRLAGEVDVRQLEDLHRWKEWRTDELQRTIKKEEYSLAILHLYSGMLRPTEDVIKQLMIKITCSSLLLIARIRNGNDADLWTSTLNYLFFARNFALIGATSSGLCGRTPLSCEYRISLALIDPIIDHHLPPPFNLGSPLEERHRMLQYLSSHHAPCSQLISPSSIPPFCANSVDATTRALLLTYRKIITLPSFSPLIPARFTVVSPHNISGSITHLQLGVSPNESNTSADGTWRLESIDKILDRVIAPSLLLIDLDGIEWSIMEEIVDLVLARKIKHISISARLFVEEDDTIRKFFSSIRRLILSNYSISHFSHDLYHLHLAIDS
ncbi:hypothetical protein PRIPAC_74314 [Pristionchus pacificus]|uniref:Uncharacterized protein n=1 Tax=Pristionchus pacificus TaxID=54126 RepID=A0A2A6CG07_PRIPA|nr:hypothetical protein PRIPAC_74314 [Pristionchus pacificus]|eukprot:PDM76951.1 hypothetical protein PRIPAC_42346 [Pristionchus pacificus]